MHVRLKVALAGVALSTSMVSAQQAVRPVTPAVKVARQSANAAAQRTAKDIRSLINGVAIDSEGRPGKHRRHDQGENDVHGKPPDGMRLTLWSRERLLRKPPQPTFARFVGESMPAMAADNSPVRPSRAEFAKTAARLRAPPHN